MGENFSPSSSIIQYKLGITWKIENKKQKQKNIASGFTLMKLLGSEENSKIPSNVIENVSNKLR